MRPTSCPIHRCQEPSARRLQVIHSGGREPALYSCRLRPHIAVIDRAGSLDHEPSASPQQRRTHASSPQRASNRSSCPSPGMTCAACAARIEKALNRLPGVKANVNLATERARIRYAPGDVTAQSLIGAIERSGYGATVVAAADDAAERARRADDYAHQRRLFWIAAALTLPLVAQMGWMLGGRTPMCCRAGFSSSWPRPCSSGSAGASTWVHGTRCAEAAPTWTCWSPWAPAQPICSAPSSPCSASTTSTSTSKPVRRSSPWC